MSHSSHPLFPRDDGPSAKPQLKLFVAPPTDGDDDSATEGAPHTANDRSTEITLPEFWRAFFLPVRLTGADPKTLKEDRTTLAKWTKYAGDRALGSIDRALLAGFLPWLQQQPNIGLVTAAKHLARIQSFLRASGPDHDGEGLCAEILQKPPRVKAPGTPTREPDKAFRLGEIASWLDACQHARPMRGCRAPQAWWQSIVLFNYCCPLRFEALTALAWEWIVERDGLPGWWFKCPWASDKKDVERWYYLSSHAIAALDIAFPSQVACLKRREPPAPGPVFGQPISPARLYAHARKILERSTISAQRREERVFHGLRAACDTELRKLGHPIAAKRALGRSVGRDVDMGFYTAAEEYAAGMEKLPQPSFARWREPQLRLF